MVIMAQQLSNSEIETAYFNRTKRDEEKREKTTTKTKEGRVAIHLPLLASYAPVLSVSGVRVPYRPPSKHRPSEALKTPG